MQEVRRREQEIAEKNSCLVEAKRKNQLVQDTVQQQIKTLQMKLEEYKTEHKCNETSEENVISSLTDKLAEVLNPCSLPSNVCSLLLDPCSKLPSPPLCYLLRAPSLLLLDLPPATILLTPIMFRCSSLSPKDWWCMLRRRTGSPLPRPTARRPRRVLGASTHPYTTRPPCPGQTSLCERLSECVRECVNE